MDSHCNTVAPKLLIATLQLVFLLATTSCSSPGGYEEVDVLEYKNGAAVVDSYTTSATVTAIDPAMRRITLETSDGKRTRFKAGPDVLNFNQIAVGDKVRANITEEFAVVLSRSETPNAAAAASVALAPKGAKPGVLMADTLELTARITAIDTRHRRVTLQFPDGTSKRLRVGKGTDLSAIMPGDSVTVWVAEGVAIDVTK